ncbi:hypothetical protein IWX49DRAFT_245370 [Phyllosticta citricarpa]
MCWLLTLVCLQVECLKQNAVPSLSSHSRHRGKAGYVVTGGQTETGPQGARRRRQWIDCLRGFREYLISSRRRLWHACIVTKNAPCRAAGFMLAAEAPGRWVHPCFMFASLHFASSVFFHVSRFLVWSHLATPDVPILSLSLCLPPSTRPSHVASDPTNSEPGQPHRVRRCNVHPSPNTCSAPASSHAKKCQMAGEPSWLSARKPPICPSRAFWTLPSHVALPSRIRMPARPCVRSPAFWSKTVHIDDVYGCHCDAALSMLFFECRPSDQMPCTVLGTYLYARPCPATHGPSSPLQGLDCRYPTS